MDKKYWKSLEELKSGPDKDYIEDHQYVNKNELIDLVQDESLQLSSNRRNFLKLFGFSIAGTALAAGCKRPVQMAIPYLFKPEEVTPGTANYYASTFFDGDDYAGILVKVRDGRPIKIEGNDLSVISQGGATARVQASLLELYDTARFRFPMLNGNETSWEEADRQIIEGLKRAAGSGKKIVVLTGTVISPSTISIIKDFINAYPGSEWIQYDPLSFSAMLESNSLCFNRRIVPSMYFDKAELIVSFEADFLGTWLMPDAFARQYASGRRLTDGRTTMSKHFQFESRMSLTGANADERIQIKSSQVSDILLYIYEKLQGQAPASTFGFNNILDEIAGMLKEKAGRSILICGNNDLRSQTIINSINHLLGNYGNTIDLTNSVNIRQGNDTSMQRLMMEMNSGGVAALIMHNVNPVFDLPHGEGFTSGLEKVSLKVALNGSPDETAALCQYVCPDSYYLESWGDSEPVSGQYSLQQPVIHPLGNTRQMQESLLVWSGKDGNYFDFLKNYWEKNLFPLSNLSGVFTDFWNECLQRGIWDVKSGKVSQPPFNRVNLDEKSTSKAEEGKLEFEIYQKIASGSGKHANNPWLQELPDPISKVCWDNYLNISVADAEFYQLQTGDIVTIDNLADIPVLVQPGQTPGTVSAAMGYGRKIAGKAGEGVGVNVIHLAQFQNGHINYHGSTVSIKKTGKKIKMALTQTHHSMEGREIVREITLPQLLSSADPGTEVHDDKDDHNVTLYEKVVFDGNHWAMAIDLNACTGCSACVIACQAENNIPVIGKDQVQRRRIMHWIRIDRYYSGGSENPGVHLMPLLCQHCDNAPCENVCPVAATNHSDEGINQIAYVRCIGTKYCINNCPYKVRRFNWYNYTRSDEFNNYMNNETGRLVLNPDVTVRERGIVEKCSFCMQRIQEAKIKAKTENRMLGDDEIKPACAQTCPSKAIIFGNIADPDSAVSHLFKNKRNYHLLEELHTLPSVGYLTKVKNKQS
jgi:Fe-S-cluster-containing dehydrogenase component/anaerobic selenocysteine-containing dehydrogenase